MKTEISTYPILYSVMHSYFDEPHFKNTMAEMANKNTAMRDYNVHIHMNKKYTVLELANRITSIYWLVCGIIKCSS